MPITPDPITRALEDVLQRLAENTGGLVADYIPQLSHVDPDLFGIALASLEGRVYSAGDAGEMFTIQSVSKPFVYAMALLDHGLESTLSRVGAEPSGRAFNAISLDPDTGRPANPMVNAGAIVTTSLVQAANAEERFERIRATLSAFAGRELDIDQSVYLSESETGDRNRALGYLMRNAGSLQAGVDETLDIYFRQCALLVSARDVAVMSATLANGGVNPVTSERIVSSEVAGYVLTVMGTCGMYDFSGEWLLRVGLPAKSGVAGAVVAARPGQFGLGVFSPRLDERGNSVRAIATCRELAERFELHLLNQPGESVSASYLDETGARMHSPAYRTDGERALLQQHGASIVIRALRGDIDFAAAESVMRSCDSFSANTNGSARWLILDLQRVGRLFRVAQALLETMAEELREVGVITLVVDTSQRGLLAGLEEFSSLDDALERCEDALLSSIT
jgi:glutaminase